MELPTFREDKRGPNSCLFTTLSSLRATISHAGLSRLSDSLHPPLRCLTTSSVAIPIEDTKDAVLHVGNLDRRVTEEELYCALQSSVAVVNITIPKQTDSTRAGYAIVQLTSGRAARKAAASCSKLELGGRQIVVWVQSSVLCPQETHIPGSDTLLFDNLAFSTTEATLYKFVSRAGIVLKTRIARDTETWKSLGYGYVQMASSEDAKRVMEIFRDPIVDSQRCRICSCLAPVDFA